MKFVTVVKREGELLGPVDWDFDFRSQFNGYCCPASWRDEECLKSKARLKAIEDGLAAKKQVRVRVSDWWHRAFQCGMYDGWPYWSPYPSVLVSEDVLGGVQWQSFDQIKEVEVSP